MSVFFKPTDYLERDPRQVSDAAEARRLRREAQQRARLCRTMTRRVAQVGFEETSAAWVFRTAKVGSGTFYKLYADRRECMLEAFERCAQTLLARVAGAERESGDGCSERLQASLGELLDVLAGDPHVARLLLIEIRTGDGACREAQQHWLARCAALLAGGGTQERDTPRRGGLAQLTGGALASLLTIDLEAEGRIPGREMLGELVWVGSLAQLGATAGAAAPSEPMEGGFAEGPAEAARRAAQARRKQAQRERLVAAMGEIAMRKGYKATHVTDVLERAELSPAVFYAHFNAKAECFLATCEALGAPTLARIEEAVASTTTPRGAAEGGLAALLGSLAKRPGLARLLTIEASATGTKGEERYGELLASFARPIAEAMGGGQADISGEVVQAVARTVANVIARKVGEGRTRQLEAMLPDLVFTVLAPCLQE